MKRVPQNEVLDDPKLSHDEAVESLGDLRVVNRWFGGVSTTADLLRRAMKKVGLRSACVLEAAAGDGYTITAAADQLRAERLEVDPVCLDRRGLNADAHCCEQTLVGDALDMTFPAGSFDFVSCGLFVHHLSPADVVEFVSGALRVARHAVLINDLRRSWLHLALVYAGLPMFKSQVSRVDGIASVKQAYTPEELRRLIEQTSAACVEIRMRYLFRMGVIIWK